MTRALHDPLRLAAVKRTGLLDSEAEESFDALTRLAATLTKAPASFLSISDGERDFYKSQQGLPEPFATSREMGGRTFCHYGLVSEHPLVIEDTHTDEVWRAVPTVQSAGVRSYLGVPMMVDGQAIGSFCVIDVEPRSWTAADIDAMTQLSKSATREIVLRGALRDARTATELLAAQARAREEVLAVVAHDLRTPLQVIGLSASALARSVDPSLRQHVDRMAGASQSMRRMVDDLLSSNAVENRGALFAAVTARRLLGDASETMRGIAERAGLVLAVTIETDTSVFVDYAQMLRVLCNLVGNCVKYCPPGRSVLLAASDLGGHVLLTVSDDGPGMSEADSARAFERGWQGNAGLARQEGAGLGLPIVRLLVEQNGGVVCLDSALGCGTSVSITLPRSHLP